MKSLIENSYEIKEQARASPFHVEPPVLWQYLLYLDRIAELEVELAKKPPQLQLNLMGQGEVHAEWALLIRSILRQRSPKTQLITNARTSLKNGSVLVWLMGDHRLIRDDAGLFLRRTDAPEDDDTDACLNWKAETDPEKSPDKTSYLKVMELINEYLPVQELAGRVIDVTELRQFGLVDNEKLDRFLKTAFGKAGESDPDVANASKRKQSQGKSKVDTSGTV